MAVENKAYENDNLFYDEATELADLKKEKFKHFVKEFLLHFKNKEKCLRHVAKCKSRFHSFFHKRNNTYEIPSEMINLMANIPLVGAIINVNVPTTNIFTKGFFNWRHFQKAKQIVNTLDKHSQPKVEAIIAVVAREIIRIYEYQLSMIKFNDIEIIAHHAVDCILVYCCSDNAKVSRNTFVSAIVNGDLPKKKSKDKVMLENGNRWSLPGVFKKPGLRRQIKKEHVGKFEFFTKDNSSENTTYKCNPEKYGYRSEVLQVDEERKQYLFWDYDKKFELQITSQIEHQKYEPMFILADNADLKNYINEINKKTQNQSLQKFSHFMSNFYSIKHKVQIVFRQVNPCCEKIDLEGADLSKVDFTYALFHKNRFSNVQNAKFYGSLFLFVSFNDVTIQNSDFYRANFLFCHFQKVNFCNIDNKFLETKMLYCRYNKIEVNKTSQFIAALFRDKLQQDPQLNASGIFEETNLSDAKDAEEEETKHSSTANLITDDPEQLTTEEESNQIISATIIGEITLPKKMEVV